MLGEIFVARYKEFEFVIKEDENSATLYSFKNGKRIDSKKLDVNWIVYLTYSEKYNLLLGASYGEGKVFSVKVENGYFVGDVLVFDEGGRSHSIILDRNEKFAYSANLGNDKIVGYKVESYGLKPCTVCNLPENTGPRHMMFNRGNNILYCVSEFSNRVFVLEQDDFTGELKLIQSETILPDGFVGESYGGTLTIQEGNKYLYLTNRGANTIALFEIIEKGFIKKIADIDMKLMNFYKGEENIYGV